jgi:hypothetical protein
MEMIAEVIPMNILAEVVAWKNLKAGIPWADQEIMMTHGIVPAGMMNIQEAIQVAAAPAGMIMTMMITITAEAAAEDAAAVGKNFLF